MINILRVQLFKLKKSKSFWVLLAMCAVLPMLSVLLLLGLDALFSAIGDESFLQLLGSEFDALYAISTFVTFESDSLIFALIFSAVVLSREFTQGTVRNTVLSNKSREQIYFAYLITGLIVGGSYFVVEYAVSLTLYGCVLGFGAMSFTEALTPALYYFALGICSVLVGISCVCAFLFCTRRQSLTILLPLLICLLLPGIVTGIINIILSGVAMDGTLPSETVLQCLPFYNMQPPVLNPSAPAGLNVGMIVVYDVVFIAIFFLIGFFSIKKADLK